MKVNVTFKEYVDFLYDAIDFSKFNYMMIIERCEIEDDNSVDVDNCLYGYLEIYG